MKLNFSVPISPKAFAALMLSTALLASPVAAQDRDRPDKGGAQGMQEKPGTTGQDKPSASQERTQTDKPAGRPDKPMKGATAAKPDKPEKLEKPDAAKGKPVEQTKKEPDATTKSDQNATIDGKKSGNGEGLKSTSPRAEDDVKPEGKAQAAAPKAKVDEPAEASKANENSTSVGNGKSVDLTTDRKDRLRNDFQKQSEVKHITNVNVDVSIGRRAPRDWSYYPVPSTIVEIVPEYRGYRYAYVDDRYVIVEPTTYEVVYVVESGAGSSRATSGNEVCSSEASFTSSDRTFILDHVRQGAVVSVNIGDLRVGVIVPDRDNVREFPTEVTSRISRLKGCRFVMLSDRVAVLDPSYKVVAIIE